MRKLLIAIPLLLATIAAHADEGMWTYDNFPSAKVAAKYGFSPSQSWLDKARLGSVRLAEGCSGSIVSPDGLVMTNHHCAHACIEQLSTAKRDYVESGFYARTSAEEVKCPEIEINQLTAITEVTKQVQKATHGLSGQKYADAQKAAFADLEKACATSADVRCDVVTLYHGGKYDLYKYRRFQDVRLVFAPEFGIAFFGGDPDNFMFPRYDLDVSFLRIYDQGKPARLGTSFGWSKAGPKEGELTFISGHPGHTSRLDTLGQLAYQRDVQLPEYLIYLSEYRGVLEEFATKSAEDARISNSPLFYTENGIKVYKGLFQALTDPKLMARKTAEEQALRKKIASTPADEKAFGGAWDAIAAAEQRLAEIHAPLYYLEFTNPARPRPLGFRSALFGYARELVRAAAELPRPNAQRLPEFSDSNLPALKQELASTAPVYPELEIETLTFSLTKLREALGPDDAVVKKLLGRKSPRALATEVIEGSKLADPAVRKALLDGGKAAIDASTNPMIQLAKRIDPDARAIRKVFEDQVKSVLDKNSALIARARFNAYGTSVYPDATFTLRLSYGAVKGWMEAGKKVAPFTTFAGAFARDTGSAPFALPRSWLDARAANKLDLSTPLDFVSDNDVVGGNSGSPVFNKEGQIVGLIFDGNIESIGGDYGFNEANNRSVSVDSAALLEALQKIYGADRIVKEIQAGSSRSF